MLKRLPFSVYVMAGAAKGPRTVHWLQSMSFAERLHRAAVWAALAGLLLNSSSIQLNGQQAGEAVALPPQLAPPAPSVEKAAPEQKTVAAPEPSKPKEASGSQSPPDVERAYNEAFQALQAGDLNGAKDKFMAFIKEHPKTALSGNAQFWIGDILRSNPVEVDSCFAETLLHRAGAGCEVIDCFAQLFERIEGVRLCH